MSSSITIRVFEVVGSASCVAASDGQKVHDQISDALRSGRQVVISFMNVDSLTSAFLNPAIGQLYGEFDEETIRARLSVADMDADDRALLKRVVDTAKRYFKDPSRFEAARQVVGVENGL